MSPDGIESVARHESAPKRRSQLRLDEGYDECSGSICAYCNGPLPADPRVQLLCPGLPSIWVAVCDECDAANHSAFPVGTLLKAMKEDIDVT